jgi:ATP synthase protein I
MATDLAAPGKRLATKGVVVQFLVGLCMLSFSLFYDPKSSLSIILGVISCLIPHSVFAYWVFRYAGATKNSVVAQSMNQGMKLKLVLTMLIFVIAFSLLHGQPLYLLGAYAITMVSQWTAMFVLSVKK